MRLLTSLASLALLLVVFCGCEGPEKPKAPEAVRLTVITVGPGADDVAVGAKAAAKYLNSQAGDTGRGVELTITNVDSADAAATALNNINQSKSAHAVAINCLDDTLQEPIDNLIATGIPVITYLNDCPQSRRDVFIGSSPEATGRKMAAALISLLNDQNRRDMTNVAIVAGNDPQLQAMAAAARNYLSSFQQIVVAPTATAELTAEGVQAAIRSIKTQNADVTDWLIIAPAAIAAADAAPLAELPSNRKGTVVYGGVEGTVDAVSSNVVDVVLARHGGEYGAAAVQVLHGMIAQHENYSRHIELGAQLVNAGNLADVQKRQEAIRQGQLVTAVYPLGASDRIPGQQPANNTEPPADSTEPSDSTQPPATGGIETPAENTEPSATDGSEATENNP